MKTDIEGMEIPYSVRRSSEASRARIDCRRGEFTVVLPEQSELEHHPPEQLLNRKKEWVCEKRKQFLNFKKKIPERSFEDGGSIKVLGDQKEINVETRRSNKVDEDIRLAAHLVERSSVKERLEEALREKAREEINSKLRKHSSKIDGDHGKVFIRDQKTKWGSCSSKDNLNFNWRLVLAPEEVLEYVVVHELVHLEHRNHSEQFWSRVGEIYPDYQESNRWLSENSAKLVFNTKKLRDR